MKEIINFRKYLTESQLNEESGKVYLSMNEDGEDGTTFDDGYHMYDVTDLSMEEIETTARKILWFDQIDDDPYPGDEEFIKNYNYDDGGYIDWDDNRISYEDEDSGYGCRIRLFKT